jgi:glyoxylase-like metal-dependent hydrolase (beta-lactamase superfamily II)
MDWNGRNGPEKLTSNLWLLGTFHFNSYLIAGDKASVLVEASVSAVVDRVITQLESLNISPDFLVLTHPHADHFTGLPALMERYPNTRLIAAEGAENFVLHPKATGMLINEDAHMNATLKAMGVEPGQPAVRELSFPKPAIVVQDNLELDLGSLTVRLTQTSGHAPGSLIAHVPQLEAVLLSDSLGFRFSNGSFVPLFFTGFKAYLNTLDHLKSLNPRILGLGHQGPLTGSQAAEGLEQARQAALELEARIKNEKGDDQRLVDELLTEYHRDEFLLYTEDNIRNCMALLVKRVREAEGGSLDELHPK